jgi:lipopolysaccharide/colanic/teichoic acid biosynthesis glycosyltransferase
MIRHVRSHNPYDPISSRIFNIAGAALLLLIIGPLLFFVVMAIRWETPGPAFEGQVSLTRYGRRFQELTFRVTEYDELGAPWSRNITRVGWFLIYTRIVSLPQLINVLRGDITFAEMYDDSLSY